MATEIKTVFVSSAASATGLGNSYTMYLQTPVKDIYKAELLYASVPNSMYNLPDGTGVISVSGNTFSIPRGYYEGVGLASELTNAIKQVSNVTVTFLSNEGKYLFTDPGKPFTVQVLSADLAQLVGLEVGVTYSSQSPPPVTPGVVPLYASNAAYPQNFLKSTNIVNTPDVGVLLLDIMELRSPVMYTGTFSNCYGSFGFNPFAVIPVDVESGKYINYKKTSWFDFEIEYPYPIERLDRLTVRWTDVNNKLVSFNGVEENYFILRLHTLRRNMITR